MKIIVAFLCFSLSVFACKVDCSQTIINTKNQTQENISKFYEEYHSTIDELVKKYKEQLLELETLQKKLKIRLAVAKNYVKQDKEIIFLLEKFNQIQSKNNDIKAEDNDNKN